jgi:hypothetical protein
MFDFCLTLTPVYTAKRKNEVSKLKEHYLFSSTSTPLLFLFFLRKTFSSVVHLAANALGIDLDVDRPTLLRGKKNFSLHTIDREELSL